MIGSFSTSSRSAASTSSCFAASSFSSWGARRLPRFRSWATPPTYSHGPRISGNSWGVDATTTREDIRGNRGNIATELGFIGRVMHGSHPKKWLNDLRARIGEPVDYTLTVT